MILIDLNQGGQTVAPGICFICEQHMTPDRRMVDTERSLPLPDDNHALLTHLHGVKYICEVCAIDAASTVMGTDLRDLANELVSLQADLDEARLKLAEVEGMDEEVLAQLRRVVNSRTIPKPRMQKQTPRPVEAEA